MNIRDFLQSVRLELGPNGDQLGAELLLAFVLDGDGAKNVDRTYLMTHGDEELLDLQVQRFDALFKRMIKGEPVAYLLGRKEFFGLDFFVDARVLIPRPETEHLVEKVLQFAGERGDTFLSERGDSASLRILDVGTGSGCIAVSLAKNLSAANVTGVDISVDALEVAQKNAQHNGVAARAEFFESDLLSAVEKPFDIIVANLPYIGEKKFNFVSKSARDFEPHVALFGGDDGLSLYSKFFQQLSQKPWRPRLLLGEFGFLQRSELAELFSKFFPQTKITFEQDLAHIDRLFMVEFPHV